MNLRVLVADDQELVRTGLSMILDAQPGIEVVSQVDNGRDAVEQALRLRPDVCLLDIRMPQLNGIEATRALAGPDVAEPMAVVVITTFDLDEYVHGALRAGARGFLLKDAGPELLAQAIHAAARGRRSHRSEYHRPVVGELRCVEPSRTAAADRTADRPRRRSAADRRQRSHECRDRRRAVHQPEHRQNPSGQLDVQARRAQPGRDSHMGLRNRPGPLSPVR